MTKPFKTNRRSFVAGATASAALAPFFIGTARASEPEHTFKLATAAPRSSPWSVSVKEVKNEVKNKSNGALKIRSYLGSALGGELTFWALSVRRPFKVGVDAAPRFARHGRAGA